jgi:hypothetical protein
MRSQACVRIQPWAFSLGWALDSLYSEPVLLYHGIMGLWAYLYHILGFFFESDRRICFVSLLMSLWARLYAWSLCSRLCSKKKENPKICCIICDGFMGLRARMCF